MSELRGGRENDNGIRHEFRHGFRGVCGQKFRIKFLGAYLIFCKALAAEKRDSRRPVGRAQAETGEVVTTVNYEISL